MRYGEARDDFRDKWLHGIAFIVVVADNRKFSLISNTRPSTSFELMLNSGPLIAFVALIVVVVAAVVVLMSADGISGIKLFKISALIVDVMCTKTYLIISLYIQ